MVSHTSPVAHARRPSAALAQRLLRAQPLVVVVQCLLVLTLAALLYLSQVAAANSVSTQLQTLQTQQQTLQRQDSSLLARLGAVRSPAYIDARARQLGFVPAPQFQPYGGQP